MSFAKLINMLYGTLTCSHIPHCLVLSHGSDQRRPTSVSYLFLKICVLIVPELDTSLSVERPSFDGLETLLVLCAPETMAVKLRSGAGSFGRGVPPRSLCGELPRWHFLRGQHLESLSHGYLTNRWVFLYEKFNNLQVDSIFLRI